MDDERSSWKLWVGLSGGVILLTGLSVWGYGAMRERSDLHRAQELAQTLNSEEGRKLPDNERREMWKELGEKMEKLPPEKRRVVMEERHKNFMAQIDRYFQMSKEEQIVHLDKEIDRWEGFRKRREEERAKEAAANGGNAAGNSGPNSPSASNTSSNSNNGQSTQSSDSSDSRSRNMRGRLDHSTPEERLKIGEYFRQMSDRRKQRGLTNSYTPGR